MQIFKCTVGSSGGARITAGKRSTNPSLRGGCAFKASTRY